MDKLLVDFLRILDEAASVEREMPIETIVVIVIFSLLFLLTIVCAIVLVYKNKKAAKQAEIINKKNQLMNDGDQQIILTK